MHRLTSALTGAALTIGALTAAAAPATAAPLPGTTVINLIPFNAAVSSVFNTIDSAFCYTYPRWSSRSTPATTNRAAQHRQSCAVVVTRPEVR